ncbi:MAG: hypothetical protein KME26_05495 [Oscillatoria princeps RMCB-10]|nr:hypothetical protein [Oscillatoria princeps RMCB-10]
MKFCDPLVLARQMRVPTGTRARGCRCGPVVRDTGTRARPAGGPVGTAAPKMGDEELDL